MKHSNFIFLIIGVTFFFFSCSKDNATMAPDQSQGDEFASSLKAKAKTVFTGTSTPFPNPDDPVINRWYDEADDSRVTGITIWDTEAVVVIDELTVQLWGTAELTVDGGLGKWELNWRGTQKFETPDGDFEIVVYAYGTGTEGKVKGMFAEWTYTMKSVDGFFYATEGYVADKQLSKTLKTIKASGPFQIVLPPNAACGDFFRLEITGNGNCSHLGLFSVENYVCFYFEGENIVPVSPWLGYITAANGKDKIETTLVYSWEVDGVDYYLYDILGGSGRFDGASGYIENYGHSTFSPDNQLIGNWFLEGEGVIVY